MANGMLNELDFEKRIGKMGDRELLEFIARQSWQHECRLHSLETINQRTFGIGAGVGGIMSGIVYGVLYFIFGSKG